MLKYAKDGVSVVLTCDTRRPKKDNKYPVKVQVVFNRAQRYYGTGKTLSAEEWDLLPHTKSRNLSAIRKDLENSFSIIKSNVEELVSENTFSFDALNTRLGRGASGTLNDAFKAKVESLLEENRIGSYNYYKDTLKFIENYAGKNIQLSAVTVDWLKKYEKYMLEKGMTYATIGIRCRAIRSIMNDAIKAGALKESQYPFGNGKYEIPTGEGRKMALTLQQIKSIVTYTDGNPTTERYRDLWFFS